MKLSVITNKAGKVIAAIERSDGYQKAGPFTVETSIRPFPGHTMREIDVPDEFRTLSVIELFKQLRPSLSRSAKTQPKSKKTAK